MQELGEKRMDGRDQAFCQRCMKSVFPETYGTMQPNRPNSKWNPTRGPSWHSAPTASGQAPRFYVHCALYGSSYIPKCQSFPQTPCKAETWTPSPSPQSSRIYSPRDLFFFNFSPPSSRDLHGPAWPGLEMHLHFHIRIGTGSSWAKVKVWLNQMPLCHSNRAFRRVQWIFTLK